MPESGFSVSVRFYARTVIGKVHMGRYYIRIYMGLLYLLSENTSASVCIMTLLSALKQQGDRQWLRITKKRTPLLAKESFEIAGIGLYNMDMPKGLMP